MTVKEYHHLLKHGNIDSGRNLLDLGKPNASIFREAVQSCVTLVHLEYIIQHHIPENTNLQTGQVSSNYFWVRYM